MIQETLETLFQITQHLYKPQCLFFFSLISRVSDPHFFFADPDPDPGKNLHADPDRAKTCGSVRIPDAAMVQSKKTFQRLCIYKKGISPPHLPRVEGGCACVQEVDPLAQETFHQGS